MPGSGRACPGLADCAAGSHHCVGALLECGPPLRILLSALQLPDGRRLGRMLAPQRRAVQGGPLLPLLHRRVLVIVIQLGVQRAQPLGGSQGGRRAGWLGGALLYCGRGVAIRACTRLICTVNFLMLVYIIKKP